MSRHRSAPHLPGLRVVLLSAQGGCRSLHRRGPAWRRSGECPGIVPRRSCLSCTSMPSLHWEVAAPFTGVGRRGGVPANSPGIVPQPHLPELRVVPSLHGDGCRPVHRSAPPWRRSGKYSRKSHGSARSARTLVSLPAIIPANPTLMRTRVSLPAMRPRVHAISASSRAPAPRRRRAATAAQRRRDGGEPRQPRSGAATAASRDGRAGRAGREGRRREAGRQPRRPATPRHSSARPTTEPVPADRAEFDSLQGLVRHSMGRVNLPVNAAHSFASALPIRSTLRRRLQRRLGHLHGWKGRVGAWRVRRATALPVYDRAGDCPEARGPVPGGSSAHAQWALRPGWSTAARNGRSCARMLRRIGSEAR
jgi:hypothetical protein